MADATQSVTAINLDSAHHLRGRVPLCSLHPMGPC